MENLKWTLEAITLPTDFLLFSLYPLRVLLNLRHKKSAYLFVLKLILCQLQIFIGRLLHLRTLLVSKQIPFAQFQTHS